MILRLITTKENGRIVVEKDTAVIAEETWQHGPHAGRDLTLALEKVLALDTTQGHISEVEVHDEGAWPSMVRMAQVTAQMVAMAHGVTPKAG